VRTGTLRDARHAPAGGTAAGDTLVRVLGPVSATIEGRLCPISSPMLRAVFALLAVSAGRVVPLDRLLTELWGEEPPASAASSVQVHVSRLRRAVGDAADREEGPAGPPLRVRRRPPGYLLEVPDGAVDAWRLERVTDAARGRLEVAPLEALDLVDSGLALVAGEPLADVVEALGPVTAGEARRLAELVLTAREVRLDALLAAGRPGEAAADAEQLLLQEPLRESLHALRLLALYRCGRQADALAAHEVLRRRLADELGVDPGPALRRLHLQLLEQDPTLDWGPPADAPAIRVSTAPLAPTGAVPVAPAGPAGDLVGRHAPLATLDEALGRARAGVGGVWLMCGEAGVGKTRLAQEVVRHAHAAGLAVAQGDAHETTDGTPYWLWSHALRELPELPRDAEVRVVLGAGGTDAPPSLTRAGLHDSVARALARHAAEVRPLLVVLEDLHWADEASLDLLGVLAPRVAAVPLIVLATYRVEDASPAGPLGALLARLARTQCVHRLPLAGLSPEESGRLLAERLGRPVDAELAAAAADRTAGNPFFLQELARLVREADDPERAFWEVPGSVRDVLLHRLSGLPEPARRVLDVAAVAGRECDLGLLEAASGLPGEQVDEGLAAAVRSGLVCEVVSPRPVLRFPHALVREALYDRLGARARMRLHARVGAAMVGRTDVDVDDVVAQLLAAGDLAPPDGTIPVVLAAADRAVSQLAPEHARGLLDRALELLPRLPEGPDRDRLELALQARRGNVVGTLLGFAAPEAETALRRAQDLALRAGSSSDAHAALYRRYLWLLMSADYPAVRSLADALLARAAAEPGRQTGDRFALLGRLARGSVLWCLGQAEPAVDELVQAVQLCDDTGVGLPVEAFGDPAVRAHMFLCHALASAGRVEQAKAVADEMVQRAAQSGPADESDALATRGMMYAAFRDPERARLDGVRGAHLARLAGAYLLEQFAALNEGWGAAVAGGPAAGGAVEMVRAAVDAYCATGTRMHDPLVFTMLAEAEAATGHPELAADAAATGLAALERTGSTLWRDRLLTLAGG
jgi:DNA-binding SARP family transcriptional activator